MSTQRPIRLTVADVADRLNVSVSAVRTMIHSGELAAIDVTARPGATRPRLRVDLSEVERFEKARRTRPAATPKRDKRDFSHIPNYV